MIYTLHPVKSESENVIREIIEEERINRFIIRGGLCDFKLSAAELGVV